MSSMPEEARQYPPVVHALVDARKRKSMASICASLNSQIHTVDEFGAPCTLSLLAMVRYGVYGPTLAVCTQWLKATETVPQT